MPDEQNDFEQRIRNEFGPCEADSAAAAIAALRDAVIAEREACATIADEHARHHANHGAMTDASVVNVVADAIRARK